AADGAGHSTFDAVGHRSNRSGVSAGLGQSGRGDFRSLPTGAGGGAVGRMSGNPRVSILMVTYSRPQLIGRAIASACEQWFRDWELIIVQDGECPDTGRLLEDWLAQEQRIRHVRRGTVGTIAEASNFGLSEARGEYVAILDDDD